MTAGSKLGPYEILAPLGAGGMGEVYKARDTRLDRTVAVKVLPSHIASREDLRARFEREARAVSSLNHPHICVLYDVGQQDGVDYMVMEHLEGETLFDRLQKGPLPLEQALKYAMQIADAVDRAHRHGVVHRDLKPGNIMLTRDGAKVLDFGLAKSAPKASADGATLTAAITTEGTVLGTPQYMAPEQIEGREADARSDIFAFGCVLYEMVTGKRAFDGKTKGSVIGAILASDPPPMSTLQPVTPRAALERLVARCLAKDPEDRYHSLPDAMLELRSVGEAPGGQPSQAPAKRRWLWPAVAGIALLAGAAGGWFLRTPDQPRSYQYTVGPPDNVEWVPTAAGFGGMALSPDGTMLAIVGRSAGKDRLWVRRLDGLVSRELAGTDGAYHPFWSPDSASIGFFTGGKLKRIDVTGGQVQTLCDAVQPRGGTWSTGGVILFGADSSIQRVPESGGTPVAVTQGRLFWPAFLPDGRHFLYYTFEEEPERRGVFVASLESPGNGKRILTGNTSAAMFAPSLGTGALRPDQGFLIFRTDRTLNARPFDAGALEFRGGAFPIGDGLQPEFATPRFSTSPHGLLAYEAGLGGRRLLWRDRKGTTAATLAKAATYGSPSLSPDGKGVAFGRYDANNWDIWLHDLRRGALSRFTFSDTFDGYNVWSPSADHIAFTGGSAVRDVLRKASSGAGEAERVAQLRNAATYDWSGDGGFLLVGHAAGPNRDISVISLNGDRRAVPLLTSSFSELHARFSPTGSAPPKWFAYDSDESGAREVYVQPFTPGKPASGARWQVSTAGGSDPRWRGDGKDLFYLSPDQKMMAVPVNTAGAAFEAGTPVALFETAAAPQTPVGWAYDVTRDGQRFLLMEPDAESSAQPITVITNWQAALKK